MRCSLVGLAALCAVLGCCPLAGGSTTAPPRTKKSKLAESKVSARGGASAKDTAAPPAEARQVKCLAFKERGGPLEPMRYKLDAELDPKEVEIVVHACGLSRADLQLAAEEDATFPMVPGREIVGHVVAAGSGVTSVRVGQRVGVGLQMGDVDGDVLVKQAAVSVGGLADRVRVRSRWAFPIPDALPTEQAAPLFGAGVQSWSHLTRAKLKRGSKVGVIGLGGIGHLAVQFAARMGHTVHVIGDEADGERAEEDGEGLGSSAFLHISDADARKKAARSYDLLLCTLDSADLQKLGLKWSDCLKLLKSDSKFCVACESAAEVSFPMKALAEQRLLLQTSAALSRNGVKEMLRFCEKNRVCALTETAEMDPTSAQKALARVGGGDVKYRLVLLRSAAMQAHRLKRREGLTVPGISSVGLPSVPLPAGLRRATDSMLAGVSQSRAAISELADKSRILLANATGSINSTAIGNQWQAAAAAMRQGAQTLASSSDTMVRSMLQKGQGALQREAGKASGKLGRGRQQGGSIGALKTIVRLAAAAAAASAAAAAACARRPPDAAIASALRQKQAALNAARISSRSKSADDEDEEEDDEEEGGDDDDDDDDDDDEEEEEEAGAPGDEEAGSTEADAEEEEEEEEEEEADEPAVVVASPAVAAKPASSTAVAVVAAVAAEATPAAASAPAEAAGAGAEQASGDAPRSDADFAAAAAGSGDGWGDEGDDEWGRETDDGEGSATS
ncbi:hypothetical protein T492DRAFT_912573 [Pavlovales sp. CCMP2436]|nr:hypothetical protein T492DRAFT_912573 [Pavlovales sp. CCMP2436]